MTQQFFFQVQLTIIRLFWWNVIGVCRSDTKERETLLTRLKLFYCKKGKTIILSILLLRENLNCKSSKLLLLLLLSHFVYSSWRSWFLLLLLLYKTQPESFCNGFWIIQIADISRFNGEIPFRHVNEYYIKGEML